jgi:hypothetical protein
MIKNKEINNWIEYTICEKCMDIFPKSKSTSTTFRAFSERLRNSIVRGNLSKREENILNSVMLNTNRQYCLPSEEISIICANFFIDRKWDKYMRAIELMKVVRWRLPDRRFPRF